MPPPWALAQRHRRASGGSGDEADRATTRRAEGAWDPHVVWTNDTTFKIECEGCALDDETIGEFIWFLEGQIEEWHGSSPPRLLATTVNFSRNRLTDVGVCSLMDFFTRCSISVGTLKFFKNLMSDAGVEAIGQYLATVHRAVQEIHLSHNHISERGAQAFFAALADSQKYPFPTEGSKHGARMPLWLRMESNRIGWARVAPHFLRERRVSWCTASSRDKWRAHDGAPPMVCMHDSYLRQEGAPPEEAAGPPEPEDRRPASPSPEAESAHPGGPHAGTDGGLLDVLQRVAPAASVQHGRSPLPSPAVRCSQAPAGSDGGVPAWELEQAAGWPGDAEPRGPRERSRDLERALQELEELPQVGDPAVYWRWHERVEAAEDPRREASRIGELVRHLVRRGYAFDLLAETSSSKAHSASVATARRGGRRGAHWDGARQEEAGRLDKPGPQAEGGNVLMALLGHTPAAAKEAPSAERATRAAAGLTRELPGPGEASAPPLRTDPGAALAAGPASRGEPPRPGGAAEAKSKKGKNKIGAAAAGGSSPPAAAAGPAPQPPPVGAPPRAAWAAEAAPAAYQ